MFEQVRSPAGRNWKLWLVVTLLLVTLLTGMIWLSRMTQMPLRSYTGQLPALTLEQAESAKRLSQDVRYLSETIGERNLTRPGTLETAAEYLVNQLKSLDYQIEEQAYVVQGRKVRNLEAKLPGSGPAAGVVVVGAHYDSVVGSPGANDNASGVAGVLELARNLRRSTHQKSIRFVLFANEEPPYFQTEEMGSLVYARQLHNEHVQVSAMISLETIGFYSDVPGSQKYPPALRLFYPDRGNFIGFVGSPESRDLVHEAVRKFRESAQFPSEGIAAPVDWPGIGWSDHWSFWQQRFPAIMVTDTAPFRYPHYHTRSDTADKVNFESMARVVHGLQEVVEALASSPH
jgi:hypothetical protein